MKNDLFKINTNHEITVAPMMEYIEEWLRKYLIQITDSYQQEIVEAIMPPPTQQISTKEAQANK